MNKNNKQFIHNHIYVIFMYIHDCFLNIYVYIYITNTTQKTAMKVHENKTNSPS